MRPPPVHFHRPYLTGAEGEYIAEALASRQLKGDGPFDRRASSTLRQMLDSGEVLLTPSGTDALELAALLLDLGDGDEVILPSFTFVSTANAFVLRGVRPVFVDIDPRTLGLDVDLAAAAITTRTRAIVAVHYGGVAVDMESLQAVADAHRLPIVEDAALSLGGSWRERPLGSLGSLAALSFHESKSIQCGEGGALVVNDPSLLPRARALRDKGTDRSDFVSGRVDHYSWTDIGSSYTMGELPAAALSAQLDGFDAIQARRHLIWSRYQTELAPWAATNGVELPAPHPHSLHSAHLFHLVLPDASARERLLHHLGDQGVEATFHYIPLHTSPYGRRLCGIVHLPVTESVAGRLVRLPLYPDLGDDEVARVIDAVTDFRC